jgi:hypothetical protein
MTDSVHLGHVADSLTVAGMYADYDEAADMAMTLLLTYPLVAAMAEKWEADTCTREELDRVVTRCATLERAKV